MIAAPLLLLYLARKHWFFLDEWDFLAHRSLGSFSDLMRPHNAEHWSTLPIIVYRTLYSVVGIRHYWPYQGVVIALHLVAVVLLRVVMRRAGVGPWTATITAGALLLLLGSGLEDIVSAFQMGFVGSLVFGLAQLLLADHDGRWDRRDWYGLAAGAASLMCSGLGITMVVVVGVSVLLRRGVRAAAGHVVPLAGLYLTWWLAEGRPTGGHQPSISWLSLAGRLVQWDASGGYGGFTGLGSSLIVGGAIGVALAAGLVLAWAPAGMSRLRGTGAPVCALAVGALVFITVSGLGRWSFGTAYARSEPVRLRRRRPVVACRGSGRGGDRSAMAVRTAGVARPPACGRARERAAVPRQPGTSARPWWTTDR